MKKYISVIAALLAIIIAFSSMSIMPTSVNADGILGDANKDEQINMQDILWIRKFLSKVDVPRRIKDGDPADCNTSGAVDTDDLFQLRRYISKLQKTFINREFETHTTVKQTTSTTSHGYTEAPFVEGGVPRYYHNQLAIRAAVNDNPYYTVAVNQVGYSTHGKKIFKLVEGFENTPEYSLIAERDIYLVDELTKQVVATFKSGKKYLCTPGKLNGTDDAWQSTVDMSSFTTPGTYRIYAPAGYSYPFTISDNPYAKAMDYMLMALYYQRCGGPVETEVLQKYADYFQSEYGDSAEDYMTKYGAHARTACHYESTNAQLKGKEVVVVDKFQVTTTFKIKTTTLATGTETSGVVKALENANLSDGKYSASSKTVKEDGKDVYYLNVDVVTPILLTETQKNNIKNVIVSQGTSNTYSYVSNSEATSFTANTDANGNVIKLPASDFAYGLHDAGDYGRYVQPASQVVADLCQAYELYPEVFTTDIIQDTNADGEKDNLPDILDQIRWEAKFLLNMQNKNVGSSTYGGFYFKICTQTFASAQYTKPEEDKAFNGKQANDHGGFRVMSVNFATSAGAAGALANTYHVFKDIDPKFANECLEAAKLGYEFYTNNRTSSPLNMTVAEKNARDVAPQGKSASGWGTGGGSYGGTGNEANSSQFYMYAALYRATKDSKYSAKISTSTVNYSMGSQAHGGYGAVQYLLMNKNNEGTTDSALVTTILNKFKSDAINNNTKTSKTSFGDTNEYGWGSIGQENTIKANAVASCFVSDSTDYTAASRSVLNFKLGTNWLGYCFITGLTEGSSKNIHHYPSVILKNENKNTRCTPGQMAAGYSQGQGTDTSFHYNDKDSDYVSNEICVYWNSTCIFAYAPVVQQDLNRTKTAEASSID